MLPRPRDLLVIPIALMLAIIKTNNIYLGFEIKSKVNKARESEEIGHFGDEENPIFPMIVDARQCSHPALSYFPDVRKTCMRGLGRIVLKTDITPTNTNKVTNSFRKRKPTFNSGSKGGKMIFNVAAITSVDIGSRKQKVTRLIAHGMIIVYPWIRCSISLLRLTSPIK